MVGSIIHYIGGHPTAATDPAYHQALADKLELMITQNKHFKSLRRYNTKFFNVERFFVDTESALDWKNFVLKKAEEHHVRIAAIDIFESEIW